jgi:Uma2 family endonuclease
MTEATTAPPRKKDRPRIYRDKRTGLPILPNGYEYVNGKIKEGAVSEESAFISGELIFQLRLWLQSNRVGVIFNGTSEQAFQCFDFLPNQLRRPDAAFVRRPWKGQFLSKEGYTKDVPELIAEVVSPSDRVYDVEQRIGEFLRAGTKLVWVINPKTRSAKVIHPDGVEWPIPETGTLEGEDILPGLSIPLASILPPPAE